MLMEVVFSAPLDLDKDGAYPSFEEASLERLGRQVLGPLGTWVLGALGQQAERRLRLVKAPREGKAASEQVHQEVDGP